MQQVRMKKDWLSLRSRSPHKEGGYTKVYAFFRGFASIFQID